MQARSITAVCCLLLCSSTALAQSETATKQSEPEKSQSIGGSNSVEWKFTDVYLKQHDPFSDTTTKAIVLIFITTDCPVANYFQPTLTRLTETYAKQKVPFFLLHSDRDTKPDVAIKHVEEFKVKAPVVLDKSQYFARRVGAKVTPEAFVIDRKGRTVYRGRINDLYADYGKRRRTPRTNDLRDALDSFLNGEQIKVAKTKAVGCYISYPKASSKASAAMKP